MCVLEIYRKLSVGQGYFVAMVTAVHCSIIYIVLILLNVIIIIFIR